VRPYLKNKVKRAVGAQVVEHWPRKHEALSSNTPTTKKKKKLGKRAEQEALRIHLPS
jgi:hypothetical protein